MRIQNYSIDFQRMKGRMKLNHGRVKKPVDYYATWHDFQIAIWDYFVRSYTKDHMFMFPISDDFTELRGSISCVFTITECMPRTLL